MAALIDAPKHAASVAPLLPLLPPSAYQQVAAPALFTSAPVFLDCHRSLQTLAGARALFMSAHHKDTFISAGDCYLTCNTQTQHI
jgi:hypothetical protein